jgi:dethiobiotin synthetase
VTRTLFVTGTDTGVGKTTVSIGLLTAWRRRGLRVAAMKPAETGCLPAHGERLWPEDAARLREATGRPETPLERVCPNRFELPAAPLVAARHERRHFDLEAVARARRELLADSPDVLLVEGAGGLLVPFAPGLTTAEVAHALAPIAFLVVARASLGTINHTALTILELRRRGHQVAGIVLNRVVAEADPSEQDNAREIETLTDTRVLGTVPHRPDDAAIDAAIDVDALYRSLPVTRPDGA